MQEHIWEKEYRDPQLVSLSSEPTMAVKDFTRFLRRECGIEITGLHILDLGCGNGKNSLYIADQGLDNEIVGIDISETALTYARKLAHEKKIEAQFIKHNIGTPLPFPDASFNIVLDVTSSNSLSEKEREIYLQEIQRIIKIGGHLFVRALCKDGDTNAQTLIKQFPGSEKDTYIMPDLGLTERVFSKEDLIALYSPAFEMVYLEKETHYTKFNNRSYKRNFWVSYWRRK